MDYLGGRQKLWTALVAALGTLATLGSLKVLSEAALQVDSTLLTWVQLGANLLQTRRTLPACRWMIETDISLGNRSLIANCRSTSYFCYYCYSTQVVYLTWRCA